MRRASTVAGLRAYGLSVAGSVVVDGTEGLWGKAQEDGQYNAGSNKGSVYSGSASVSRTACWFNNRRELERCSTVACSVHRRTVTRALVSMVSCCCRYGSNDGDDSAGPSGKRRRHRCGCAVPGRLELHERPLPCDRWRLVDLHTALLTAALSLWNIGVFECLLVSARGFALGRTRTHQPGHIAFAFRPNNNNNTRGDCTAPATPHRPGGSFRVSACQSPTGRARRKLQARAVSGRRCRRRSHVGSGGARCRWPRRARLRTGGPESGGGGNIYRYENR